MDNRGRTLVTGFGAFGSVEDNPSAHLAAASGRPYRVLPVSFRAVEAFLSEIQADSFDRLLMLGVAQARAKITPELVARNEIGPTPDVDRAVLTGPVDTSSPTTLGGTLWTGSAPAIDEVSLSSDAGTYLCNFIYFRALLRFPDKRVGFLHVPSLSAIPLGRQIEVVTELILPYERL